MGSKVEPGLLKLLEADDDAAEPIDVVIRFDLPDPAQATAAGSTLMQRREALARSMTATIEQALSRAGDTAGQSPTAVSLFPSVGSAFVQAKRPFVRALLDQAEVLGATLNCRDTPSGK